MFVGVRVMSTTVVDKSSEAEEEAVEFRSPREVMEKPVDMRRNRYPYCIVWTPLPLITLVAVD